MNVAYVEKWGVQGGLKGEQFDATSQNGWHFDPCETTPVAKY
jgi:hypothetical protein